MDVILEFATPIGMFYLDKNMCDSYAMTVKDIIQKGEGDVFRYRDISETTPDDLHERLEFKPVVDTIQKHVDNFANEIIGIDPADIKMSCMWSNAHNSGSKHHFHTHPNSFLSGVLYLQCPDAEQIGNLVFNDPRLQKNLWFPDFKKKTSLSERTIWVEPLTGLLLLFPSWLEHGTDEFISKNNEQRISMSFNYVLKHASTKTMRM